MTTEQSGNEAVEGSGTEANFHRDLLLVFMIIAVILGALKAYFAPSTTPSAQLVRLHN